MLSCCEWFQQLDLEKLQRNADLSISGSLLHLNPTAASLTRQQSSAESSGRAVPCPSAVTQDTPASGCLRITFHGLLTETHCTFSSMPSEAPAPPPDHYQSSSRPADDAGKMHSATSADSMTKPQGQTRVAPGPAEGLPSRQSFQKGQLEAPSRRAGNQFPWRPGVIDACRKMLLGAGFQAGAQFAVGTIVIGCFFWYQ